MKKHLIILNRILVIPFNLDRVNSNDLTPVEIKSKISEMQVSTDNDYTGKKRRREQYENESIISEWVEVDKQLYNEEQFEYYEEPVVSEVCKAKFCLYCNFLKIFDTS
jgi:hypothetical protein